MLQDHIMVLRIAEPPVKAVALDHVRKYVIVHALAAVKEERDNN